MHTFDAIAQVRQSVAGVFGLKAMKRFNPGDYDLVPLRCETWQGFVFLTLDKEAEPLLTYLDDLVDVFARFDFGPLRLAKRETYDVAANWKILVENYSECYHCSPLHPSLVKLSPPTSGENDLIEGPILGGFMTITGEGGSMTLSGRACGVPVGDLSAADRQRVYYYSIFPGMLRGFLEESMLKRAAARDIVRYRVIDLRDFTHDVHRTVDDRPYGGGPGMVMKPEPLSAAVESAATPGARIILMTPQGLKRTQ
jgi:hypothetical protein